VGLLAGHQKLGGARVGVQRVGGDHHAGKVQAGQQRLEAGDLARGAVDRALGQHRTGGMVHRGQQMDLPAIVAFGAAQGLAVDRHRPPPMPLGWMAWVVAVGEPGSEHRRQRGWVHAGKRSADSGLGRHNPPARAVAAGAERSPHRLGGVGGPLGDRGHRLGAGHDRGRGDGQDRGQRVAAAAGPSGVVDGGQVGQQVCRFGWSERGGVGELGQGGWD
jgi:hypothetical protein